jgi:flavin-dependent dehydrogenase
MVVPGAPPATTSTTDFGDFPLSGSNLVADGVALGYGPRRSVLDNILVDAAVEAGAELREGFAIQDFVADGDRIVGVRGRDKRSGVLATERATITIGADGRNSRLARSVDAPVYNSYPTLAFYYFSYWSGVPTNGIEIYVRKNRVLFGFPTGDDQLALFIGWPAAELAAVRRDLESQFLLAVDLVPELADRLRCGERDERFYGATDLPNFYRKPYGPGWALVGDAGCHKDPFLALGICDAFRDADWLAEALDDGLSGRLELDAALAGFERRRNEASAVDYQRNLAAAQFLPLPPDVMQLRAAVRGNQAATDQFYMANEGMISPE